MSQDHKFYTNYMTLQIKKLYFLQNIKIYNKNINPITFTDIGVECKEFSIIKNSYYDNFYAKLLVNFNQTNFRSENIIVVKFINRRFFYYTKITFSKIDLMIPFFFWLFPRFLSIFLTFLVLFLIICY